MAFRVLIELICDASLILFLAGCLFFAWNMRPRRWWTFGMILLISSLGIAEVVTAVTTGKTLSDQFGIWWVKDRTAAETDLGIFILAFLFLGVHLWTSGILQKKKPPH